MLATAGSSPLEVPPVLPVSSTSTQSLNRKRKHTAITDSAPASSPAPSDSGITTENINIVLPSTNDLTSRPSLTISRHPAFGPLPDGAEYYTTELLAMNRMGFKYTPAGVAPPGSPLPCRTIQSAPTCYRVSWEDRSPFVKVTADGLGLAGDTGFRSARCNAPIREGRWYMEVKIERGGGECPGESSARQGSHVRLGWGRREAPLNGPVGLDGYSYGIRDKSGEKVTLSRPRPYGRPFRSGDVIGMYICLPPRRQPNKNDAHDPAHIKRERIAIEFKGQEYFESVEYAQSKEMISLMDYSGKSASTSSVPSSAKKSATVKNLPERGRANKGLVEPAVLRPLPTLPGSYMAFFINGKCQGIAFQDLYDYIPLPTTQASRKGKEKRRGREGLEHKKENPFDDGSLGYYPFISLFNEARVRLNAGPDFDFPPPLDIDAVVTNAGEPPDTKHPTWRPICDRYAEHMAEQWALDTEEEEEAKADAAHKAATEKAEADRKAQRDKKRREAENRRRAKKAAEQAEGESSTAMLDGDRVGPPSVILDYGLLNLRHLAMPSALGDPVPDQAHSPAPMSNSTVYMPGAHDEHHLEHANAEEDEVLDALPGHPDSIMTGQHSWADASYREEML